MAGKSDVIVSEARREDIEQICRWNMELAETTEGIQLDLETLRRGVGAVLDDPGKARYFVARLGGVAVGMIMTTYEWSDWRNGMFFWIQSVFVAEAYRRQGVFRALYRHVEAVATGEGGCGLRLYVHRDNEAAQRVYERLGMVGQHYSVLETPDSLKL